MMTNKDYKSLLEKDDYSIVYEFTEDSTPHCKVAVDLYFLDRSGTKWVYAQTVYNIFDYLEEHSACEWVEMLIHKRWGGYIKRATYIRRENAYLLTTTQGDRVMLKNWKLSEDTEGGDE